MEGWEDDWWSNRKEWRPIHFTHNNMEQKSAILMFGKPCNNFSSVILYLPWNRIKSFFFFKNRNFRYELFFIIILFLLLFFCCSKALDIFFLFILFIYVHMYHKYWYRKHIFYVGNIILCFFFIKYKEEIEGMEGEKDEGDWSSNEKKRNEKKLYMKRNHIKSLRRKWRMLCNKLGNLKISMES